MDLVEAINQRRSARAFLEKPVDREILAELLRLATQAPSAINLQPWEFTVVSGEERRRLSRLLVKRMRERNVSCAPGAKKPLPATFTERQRDLLETIQPRLQKGTDFQTFINVGSCNFYGAPTAVIVSMDQAFSKARLTDIGVMVGYLVLAAHALGLNTCPIGLITAIDEDIKEELSLDDGKQVVIGIAVGYGDPDAAINGVHSNRAPLEQLVRWRQ